MIRPEINPRAPSPSPLPAGLRESGLTRRRITVSRISCGHDVYEKSDLQSRTIFTLLKFFCNVITACLCYYWGRQTTKANPVKTGDAKPWVFDTRTLWVKIARPPKVLIPVLSVGPGFHQPGLFCRMSPGHCPVITASQETLSRNIDPIPPFMPVERLNINVWNSPVRLLSLLSRYWNFLSRFLSLLSRFSIFLIRFSTPYRPSDYISGFIEKFI